MHSSGDRAPDPADAPSSDPTRPPTIDVRIVDGPVVMPDESAGPAGSGAECVFLGRTRAETHPEFGALVALDYECHAALAEATLRDLATHAAAAHDCQLVRVLHARGRVPVGAASVLVQVCTGHRAESFAAGRLLIDRLKEIAPIWKHEVWAEGTTWQAGRPVDPPSDTNDDAGPRDGEASS